MSLLLSRLRLGKQALVRRSSLLLLSNGFSSSLLQTPPCSVLCAAECGGGFGKLVIMNAYGRDFDFLEKKVPMKLVYGEDGMVTIGAAHGWVATLTDDGILSLQDDLNPAASYTDPKRISLPPLVTLPHCQTKIVTNVTMSSSSPEEEDCVVAVKFLGPQLSFCKPAQSEWTNIRIQNPCFYSSPVMFSKKDDTFRMPGSGGDLIGSWSFRKRKNAPKLQKLRFRNIPDLTETKRELLHSCFTTEHLVESRSTGETFLIKWYRKTVNDDGFPQLKTQALMVFKIDEKGNAVYTQDIGDLCIFLSQSEPFTVPSSSFPRFLPNFVIIYDFDEIAYVQLDDSPIIGGIGKYSAPYHIPPQNTAN